MESEDNPGFFGEWIKNRRRSLDLTQEELAERTGCSVSALRKYESGERRPSKQLAVLLAESLEVPESDQDVFIGVARGGLSIERLSNSDQIKSTAHLIQQGRKSSISWIPEAATPLVGREVELNALESMLRDPRCRMVTLVGPGGIGKTRLAVEAACRLKEFFSGRAQFISLASINSSAHLVPTIATSLGYIFQGQLKPQEQLMKYLREEHLLLVLDNVEHLLDGAALFGEILLHAPGVKLLVTSREKMNLHGEWMFEIQGLPIPKDNQFDSIRRYSAVELFMQSARRAQASFELNAEDEPYVARICQMVDGMPLGIELATAWITMLSCREIAEEIERSMDFLSIRMKDVPTRQRSLRATFEHSWMLLSRDEGEALLKLAVFRGGFDRKAAEYVAGANLEVLMSLASKSLLFKSEYGRYDLHEVIRQYAFAKLSEDTKYFETADRHCDYYLTLLSELEGDLKGFAQQEAVNELTREVDNLRLAWKWANDNKKFLLIGKSLRSFAWLFEMRGWFREGIEQIDLVVQKLNEISGINQLPEIFGQALTQQGLLLFRQGQFGQALTRYEKSLAILRPLNDPGLLLDALVFSGIINFLNGEYEQSQSVLEECLEYAQKVNDRWIEAYANYSLGAVASYKGYTSESYKLMLVGIKMWRALGDSRYVALGLNWISPTAIKLGLFVEAQAYLQESLDLCLQVGDRWGIGTAYRHLGLLNLSQGYTEDALNLFQKSLDTFNGYITGWDVVRTLVYIGEVELSEGNLTEARQIFLDSLKIAREAQANSLMLEIFRELSQLKLLNQEAQEALQLSLFVIGNNASAQDIKDRASQIVLETKKQVSGEQLESARVWARTQTIENVAADLIGLD